MKYNNFLIALALCAGLQSTVGLQAMEPKTAEVPTAIPVAPVAEQSYYQQYAPTRLKNVVSGVSSGMSSLYQSAGNFASRVKNWSLENKKTALVILVGALAYLGKDQLMQLLNYAVNKEAIKEGVPPVVLSWKNPDMSDIETMVKAFDETNKAMWRKKLSTGRFEYLRSRRDLLGDMIDNACSYLGVPNEQVWQNDRLRGR